MTIMMLGKIDLFQVTTSDSIVIHSRCIGVLCGHVDGESPGWANISNQTSSRRGIWCGGGSTFKGVGVAVLLGMDTIIPSLSEADNGIDVAVGCGMSGCALETAVPKS